MNAGSGVPPMRSVLVLLDADGRVVARTERIGGTPDPAFMEAVRGVLQQPPAHAH